MEKERFKASATDVPAIVATAGAHAVGEYRAFFAAYANSLTRQIYQNHAERFFRWSEARELTLTEIQLFDTIFYTNELAQSLAPTSARQHRSTIRRLFRHLKQACVIGENPFDESVLHGEIPAGSDTAAAWQATVDAAQVSLVIDAFQQTGAFQNDPPVNVRLCEQVLALGQERGITPGADVEDNFIAAVFEAAREAQADSQSDAAQAAETSQDSPNE